MQETVESVKRYGILMPGIVRPYGDGEYEMVAGHRRWRACELAGMEEMPVIIREMDDDTGDNGRYEHPKGRYSAQ